jgi:membrane-bound inhibitor of C-type lysozyme
MVVAIQMHAFAASGKRFSNGGYMGWDSTGQGARKRASLPIGISPL